MKLRLLACVTTLAATAGLSACGSSGEDGGAKGGSTSLDVWLMRDSVSAG